MIFLAWPRVYRLVHSFERLLDPLFRSEGIGYGDVKDGENDILVGDYWYESPVKAHEIRKPRKPNRGGYTEAAVYSTTSIAMAGSM